MGSRPSGESPGLGVVPVGALSWWGVVLDGSCPRGESSGWELSWWGLSSGKLS